MNPPFPAPNDDLPPLVPTNRSRCASYDAFREGEHMRRQMMSKCLAGGQLPCIRRRYELHIHEKLHETSRNRVATYTKHWLRGPLHTPTYTLKNRVCSKPWAGVGDPACLSPLVAGIAGFQLPARREPANSAGSDPGMGGYRAARYPSRYPPTINEGLIPGTRYPPASIYLTTPATRCLPATKRYRVAKPGSE